MTLFAVRLSYKGELLLAFEFAVFSDRFKFFCLERRRSFHDVQPSGRWGVVPLPGRVTLVAVRKAADHLVRPTIPETEYFRGFPSRDDAGALERTFSTTRRDYIGF